MRRRSISNDQYDESIKNISNKRERRRQTQPIRLNMTTQSLSNNKDKLNLIKHEVPINININEAMTDANVENISLDLPEPPPIILQTNENKTDQKEDFETELAKTIIQGILETDF